MYTFLHPIQRFAIPPPPPPAPRAVYTAADSVLAISLRAESLSLYIYIFRYKTLRNTTRSSTYTHLYIHFCNVYNTPDTHICVVPIRVYNIIMYKIYCTRLACVRPARLTNHPSWISVSVAAVVLWIRDEGINWYVAVVPLKSGGGGDERCCCRGGHTDGRRWDIYIIYGGSTVCVGVLIHLYIYIYSVVIVAELLLLQHKKTVYMYI